MRNQESTLLLPTKSAPGATGAMSANVGRGQLTSRQLSRRMFMRRGALMAAGGLVAATAAGTVAIPGWARWLGEQMEKLQPKPRVEIRSAQPLYTRWTFDPEGEGGFQAAWSVLNPTLALVAYTVNLWFGLKEA